MRAVPVLLLVAALQVVATARQLGPGSPAPGTFVLSQFESYLEALRRQAGIPGMAAALVGDQSIGWERGFGHQDLEQLVPAAPDTPFHVDGLTQIVTATLVLRCVEEGRISLDDPLARFDPASPHGAATIREVLTHSSGPSGSATYAYRPERFAPLQAAMRLCTGNSFRETLASTLTQFGMNNSVPGADVLALVPPAEGIPTVADAQRYSEVLSRLATPYALDFAGNTSRSQYAAATLTPAEGLISSVRDFAQFDLAVRNGLIIRPDTRVLSWQVPIGPDGQRLPHGLGWFVQTFNGEMVAWQFGMSSQASSSLVITLPGRGLTFVLFANSDGLVAPFALSGGDLTASPFGRVFLGFFVP